MPTRGRVDNPYFLGSRPVAEARPFSHREHDIYLVSRLDAFTVEEAKALVDRAARTAREGQIVLDQRDALVNRLGRGLAGAGRAKHLTKAGHGERVVLETTPKPARDVSPVMGYFSWGSTDPQNRVRTVKMDFVPGAIGATLRQHRRTHVQGAAGRLAADQHERSRHMVRRVAAVARGRPDPGGADGRGRPGVGALSAERRSPGCVVSRLPAGFNLVESFYLAIPHLSWQTVVIGDPLCVPFARRPLTRADIEGGTDDDLGQPAFFAKRRVAHMLTTLPGAPESGRATFDSCGRLTFGTTTGRRPGRHVEQASELAPSAVAIHILLAELYIDSGGGRPGRRALPQGDRAPAQQRRPR